MVFFPLNGAGFFFNYSFLFVPFLVAFPSCFLRRGGCGEGQKLNSRIHFPLQHPSCAAPVRPVRASGMNTRDDFSLWALGFPATQSWELRIYQDRQPNTRWKPVTIVHSFTRPVSMCRLFMRFLWALEDHTEWWAPLLSFNGFFFRCNGLSLEMKAVLPDLIFLKRARRPKQLKFKLHERSLSFAQPFSPLALPFSVLQIWRKKMLS